MSTPIPSGAAALGGPLEVTSDPMLLFQREPLAMPTFTSPATRPPPDPSGITAQLLGSNGVEVTLPLFNDHGAQINVIGGARGNSFVSGVGVGLADGDFKLDASYRRLTPADLQSEGTDLYAGSLTVGGDLRFTAGVAVQDAPGLRNDSTTINAGLTAPLGNGWTGSVNGRAVLRPGNDNDTVGAGLQLGNGSVNFGADLSQTGATTVGTVRFGINF